MTSAASGRTTRPKGKLWGGMVAELANFQRAVGRYLLFGEIGSGGMAVHVGRLAPAGFSKLVAQLRGLW